MSNVIYLGNLIAKWDKSPTLNIHEHRKRDHTRRAWFFQRRMLGLNNAVDKIARSISRDSLQPKREEPPDAS